MEYYGVSNLSEYPIVDPELWFSFTIDDLPFNMAVEFGFNNTMPHCNLYTGIENSSDLDRQAELLRETLTELYGESNYEYGGAEYFVDAEDPDQWEVQFYTWRADAPSEGFSQLDLDITYYQGSVREIQLGLCRVFRLG